MTSKPPAPAGRAQAKHRFYNALALLSAMLCLATLLLLATSFWYSDYVLFRSRGWASLYLSTNRGSLDVMCAQSVPDHFEFGRAPASPARHPMWTLRPDHSWRGLGFGFYACAAIQGPFLDLHEQPVPFIETVVPLWAVALLFAIGPLFWLRGRRRMAPGLCPTCGYDLRATPNRCPECGTVTEK